MSNLKVMVFSPYLPHARVGHGGGTAVRDLVTWLVKKHEVMLVTMLRPGEENFVEEVRHLAPSDRLRVETIPYTDNMARGRRRFSLIRSRTLAAGRSVLSGYPYYVTKYYTRRNSQRLLELIQDFQPDAIQVEYLQLSLYVRDISRWRKGQRISHPRLILNSHELGSLPRERRTAATSSLVLRKLATKEAAAWRRLQVEASTWADATLCVTPGDQDLYEAMGGQNLTTVPLGMDLSAITQCWAPALPERFLFVGSFGHRPNRLAAKFLVEEAWPVIQEKRPEARLVLAGRGSDQWLAQHRSRHPQTSAQMDAVGFVDDLTPLFTECQLFLAPLAQGGGIKIKILEALARGIPLVTTPIGAEGIFEPEDDVALIASCDGEFALAAVDAAQDLEGCKKRALKARAHMENNFSWDSITDQLTDIYTQK